jgi:hypothetical protein
MIRVADSRLRVFAEQALCTLEVVEEHRTSGRTIVGPPVLDPVDLATRLARDLEPHTPVVAQIRGAIVASPGPSKKSSV